ncbi:CoA-acylating methylmalonate-semialdehyde dehydrogenase [Acidianus manzaensis]|uniref:methylmalonate-semialdehyde dehydrogenase (CoA acylating) n=1 Tax=Acidianus manzaensis TaxID=282676 RepID=A0A1W6JWW1_9CREN|nr:CoA-acylating methylmalonate-semialdehyde dehydrogenase [Acidianus manzaensis]ARM74704.1 methylmalonate-semialdehyde dehydrogenase (CoA acylating) [Acidianus manzaensis]
MLLEEIKRDYGNLKIYINGEIKESKTDTWGKAFNPTKDEVIANVPFSTRDEVREAIQSANEAFEKWKEIPITQRIQYLFAIKNKLEEYSETIARMITQNHGKTIIEARGDMRRSIENVEAAISVAYTLYKGEHLDLVSSEVDETVVREPLGVFGIITPFNFPVMVPFWFLPYAIVLGNTVVIKPSEITPVPIEMIIRIFEEVKLPKGVVNVVHGAKDVVDEMFSNKLIQGVTFVGSTKVGKYIYENSAKYGKKAIVQAGAKNFVVVMPDADFNKTIPSIVSAFFGNAGQRCLAAANLVVVGDVYDEVKRKFIEASKQLKLGYGLDDTVDMGPVVTNDAKKRILGYIDKGIKEGAKLVLDGRNVRIQEYPNGYFIGPTIFNEVTPEMIIAKEEIFGPVASIIHAKSLDEAIDMINKSNYGNAASIFTSSGYYARKFRMEVNAGNIGINVGVAAPMAFFPFGGRKESFFGVLHGQIDSVEFFTDKKVVITRW